MAATKKTSVKKPAKKTAAAEVPKKKSPGKATGKTQRKAAYGVHGNRGSIWPPAWAALAEVYGGNVALAEAIGVTYQTAYRWAALGAGVPAAMVKLIGMMAAQHGLPNPAIDQQL